MKKIACFILIVVFFTIGCALEKDNHESPIMNLDELKNTPASYWKNLASQKIYFGHQSVGFNIIDGIDDITKEIPESSLNIEETKEAAALVKPVFAHSKMGRNTDPFSKCDDFKAAMESGIGDRVDIAFFKFCYVDFNATTDIDRVFQYYSLMMEDLARTYPRVTFIHFTAPLKSEETGVKPLLKKLIGKAVDADNIARNKFNSLMRMKYSGGLLFDLAAYESKSPAFGQGNRNEGLRPEYTDDGGHLNREGRRAIAAALLSFLLLHTHNKG
jgi:hypothetical protein